jgi:hypothetical protein
MKGAVHKLCRIKIGDFDPLPPILLFSYKVKLAIFDPPPYLDDIVYGRIMDGPKDNLLNRYSTLQFMTKKYGKKYSGKYCLVMALI